MVRHREVWTQLCEIPNATVELRITTFVCSEAEVKVIDPNKLEVIEAVGCRIREACI